MDHTREQCQVCKKQFTAADDVVICPSCGAPYHRECYQKEGHCVYASKHSSGFEYMPDGEPRKAAPGAAAPAATTASSAPAGGGEAAQQGGQAAGSASIMRCPSCNTTNNSRSIFCVNCGFPLHAQGEDPAAGPQAQNPFGGAQGGPGGGFGYGPGYGGAGNPFGGFGPQAAWAGVDMNGELDGIPKKDWQKFIGQNAQTYLMRMSQMEGRKGGISFMISAFFLGPFYFAYRKLWGWAAAALASSFVLQLPTFVEISRQAGQNVLPFLSDSALGTISLVAYYLSVFLSILWGLFALRLYQKNGSKKIKKLRDKFGDDPNYQYALPAAGGVSVPGVIGCVVILFILSMVLSALFGEAILAYLSQMLPL